jgi:type II secretory ATPase GspE/PulE/Tfp pilus assembly ATPase PilB-like protein
LNQLGIDKEILCEPKFLLILVYQTLVKVPCQHCSHSINESQFNFLKSKLEKLIDLYQLDISLLKNIKIINSHGCDKCLNGVIGRTIIAEIVEPDLEILGALRNSDYVLAHKLWREKGGITYQEHALEKILKGEICPVNYESKVQSLDDLGFYAEIDKPFYAEIFKDVEWGESC